MQPSLAAGAEIRVVSWLSARADGAAVVAVATRPTPPAPAPVARRVSVAFLRQLYDALPAPHRAALWVAGVTWSARSIRVESSLVAVGSEAHRALVAAVERHATRVFVEIPEDAQRCRWCGCVNTFACVGGCAWVQIDRCSACRDRRTPEPTHALAPGALTPGALDTAATRRRGR